MGTDADPTRDDLPAPARSGVSPDVVRSFRWQLTPGEDVIDTATWAGSIPQVNGIAPRVRGGSQEVVQPALAASDRVRAAPGWGRRRTRTLLHEPSGDAVGFGSS